MGTTAEAIETKELQIYKLSSTPPQVINQEIERLVSQFEDGVDYGTIYSQKSGQAIGKPSLWKPGSEKVCVMFNLDPQFCQDTEVLNMLGNPKGLVALKCQLIDRTTGQRVGEGRGCAMLGDKGRDFNTTVKIAEKSAQIDAVLRTFALSQRFTQDLEDMPKANLEGQETHAKAIFRDYSLNKPSEPIIQDLGAKNAIQEPKTKDYRHLIDNMLDWAIAMKGGNIEEANDMILEASAFPNDKGKIIKANSLEHLSRSTKWIQSTYGKMRDIWEKWNKNELPESREVR